MELVREGDLLRSPTAAEIQNSRLREFQSFVESSVKKHFGNYEELWSFSTSEVELFWNLIWEFFEVKGSKPRELENIVYSWSEANRRLVLSSRQMPGGRWFEGSNCNYAENALSHPDEQLAVICQSESRPELRSFTYRELRAEVARIQRFLKDLGVSAGDRVAAYAPNIFETVAFFLASASVGAIWSSCSPDFGISAVVDRFAQIEPKVLFAVDGYHYDGKLIQRNEEIVAIAQALPTLSATVVLNYSGSFNHQMLSDRVRDYSEVISGQQQLTEPYFEKIDFSHPLWILYSSGTTGLPKPIVQSHGGIVLEHLKAIGLHLDLRAGDRFFWYTTTGWMMWNFLVSSLLLGVTAVLFDGSPTFPDLNRLWRLAESTKMTYFGTSASFIQSCQKTGLHPGNEFNLSSLTGVGSTGSPLSPGNFIWIYENISSELQLASVSGGTDVCTAFLGSSPWHPCRAGEIAARCLGCKISAYDEAGRSVLDQVGELVIEEPMPSMPLQFWNDPDGSKLFEAYYSHYPGKWRHGDWIKIKPSGACVIYGRSDSTLNRGGIRMGTSDFYRVIESFDEISDSLVVDTSHLGREGELIAFVVMNPQYKLTPALSGAVKAKIRSGLSPRHVPDRIVPVPSIPRTINGKKMEIPVKRILCGEEPEKVVAKGALSDPNSLDFYVDYLKEIQN